MCQTLLELLIIKYAALSVWWRWMEEKHQMKGLFVFFPMKQFSTRFDFICFLRQTANPHVEQNHNIYQQNAEPSL